MTTSEADKVKMQAARLMIEERRYSVAREMLKGVADPQALDWLLKIEGFIPRKKHSVSIGALLATLFMIITGFLAFLILVRERENEHLILQAQRFDGIVLLSFYCTDLETNLENYPARSDACGTWATSLITNKPSLARTAIMCSGGLEMLLTTQTEEQKATAVQCLAANGIPLLS